MLSNQTPNLNTGRQQRQNSTPNNFATANNPLSANSFQHASHRRGLSLNEPTNDQPPFTRNLQKDDIMDFTHQGFENYQRHLLQEAHQQQPLAGPGQDTPRQIPTKQGCTKEIGQTPYPEYGHCTFTNDILISTRALLNDNNITKRLNKNMTEIMYEQPCTGTIDFAGYLEGFEIGAGQGVGTTRFAGGLEMNSTLNGNGVLNLNSLKPSSQSGPERPCTPQNQSNSCYFPLTPDATPFSQIKRTQITAGTRPVESPTKDPNSTIKASRSMKSGCSVQDAFQTKIVSAEAFTTLSPPNSERLKPVSSIDLADFPEMDFMDLNTINMDLLGQRESYNAAPHSLSSQTISSNNSSFQSSPEAAYLSSFESSPEITNSPLFRHSVLAISSEKSNSRDSQGTLDARGVSTPPTLSLHSRSQSISDFDIDAAVEDTGISSEEIAAYISGPDPLNGRWMCTYPNCNRGFGRKENIKSHVQTHLGDRQYRCMHCGNTFVRQHDLKRHAKIHSGVKPYPCPCGSSFARHDALTRHRQRNTCIGGFEGICKSPIKRGRPRKIRPDMDARQSKAATTRQRALEKAIRASPSPAGTSIAEDLSELPPSQAMSRENSTSYYSTSPTVDMFPPLASPSPTFGFDFDLGSMGSFDTQSFAGHSMLDLDEELKLMLPSSNNPEALAQLERELMEQLEEFNGPLSPLPGEI